MTRRSATPATLRRHLSLVLGIALVQGVAVRPAARAQGLPAVCNSPGPEPCLYVPATTWQTATQDFVLRDPERNQHEVPFRVYYPLNTPAGLRPTVIWSHGGAIEDPAKPGSNMDASEQRGKSFAAAGYVSIHVVRRSVDNPLPADLLACVEAGVITSTAATGQPLQNCKDWLGAYIHGPRSVAFIARVLPLYQVGMLPGFIGTPVPDRLVVGGWSAGSGVPLHIAGTTQQYGQYKVPQVDVPGAVAFIADSPRGPAYAGFNSGLGEDSYYSIDTRPFLFFTGRGDETGEPAESRLAGWIASKPGNKLLSWDLSPEAVHGTMDVAECSTSLRADHCRWMKSLAVAFLDAVVMNQPQAQAWLASDAYRTLTNGAIELHRR